MSRHRGRSDYERLDLAKFKADWTAGVLCKVLVERYNLRNPQSVCNLRKWMGLAPRRSTTPRLAPVTVRVRNDTLDEVARRAHGKGIPIMTLVEHYLRAGLASEKTT